MAFTFISMGNDALIFKTCSYLLTFFFLNTINCITASGCSRDQIWTQILNVPLFYWVIDALAWFWRGFLVVISIILHTSKCHFTPFKVPSHDINLIIFLMIKLHLVPQILTWHLLNVLNLHNAENRLARKVHVYYLGEWRWNQEIELASSFHRLLIRAQLQHLKRRKKKNAKVLYPPTYSPAACVLQHLLKLRNTPGHMRRSQEEADRTREHAAADDDSKCVTSQALLCLRHTNAYKYSHDRVDFLLYPWHLTFPSVLGRGKLQMLYRGDQKPVHWVTWMESDLERK